MKRTAIFAGAVSLLVMALLIIGAKISPLAVSEFSANLEVEIPEEYRSLNPGGEIWFTTKLLNLAQVGRRDVTLKYEIQNSQGSTIASKSETVAVETQASFVNSLQVPKETPAGDYVLRISLSSSEDEDITSTENSFTVVEAEKIVFYKQYVLPSIVVLSLVAILIILFLARPLMRKLKLRSKINSIVKKRLKEIKSN